jgi:Pyruvate/2-oxoacid:ferredoxin oxidoreductase delta subunit
MTVMTAMMMRKTALTGKAMTAMTSFRKWKKAKPIQSPSRCLTRQQCQFFPSGASYILVGHSKKSQLIYEKYLPEKRRHN